LWEVFSDGTEVLKAKFSTAQNKFIPVPWQLELEHIHYMKI
jgi:hypothetical protein